MLSNKTTAIRLFSFGRLVPLGRVELPTHGLGMWPAIASQACSGSQKSRYVSLRLLLTFADGLADGLAEFPGIKKIFYNLQKMY